MRSGQRTLENEVADAAVDLFTQMGWTWKNVYHETFGEHGMLGRETMGEVVLVRRLQPALERLNPDVPPEAIQQAVDALCRDRSAMGLVHANRDGYRLIKEGVKVKVRGAADEDDRDVTVQVIDWADPSRNDFFVARELWVQGDVYKRRADLVGFVNGLPLVFIELKGIHRHIENAFNDNFRDYLGTIPQIFWFNAVSLVSNGFQSRVGSITGAWEHFKEWKRIERENEPAKVSLEVVLRGVCDKARLLDLVENFVLFSELKSGVVKVFGQNHQYLGVNNAIEAVKRYQLTASAAARRLGVFWHTQGSGKSFSMVFFSQKILRKIPGNWTFVILTDREDLDDQIYKTFVACHAVTDKNVQAKSAEHLKRLLTEDHRYVFTLIQKFRTDVKGATYPKLSDRSDIIVVADEAHRTQYDTFALNLRNALPNAAFIGFTGTPLMAGEQKTREVFGDYVSIYNFRQAIEDNATVPLYYEARIPELQLTNTELADDLADVIEEADLDERQQEKVEREFARQYHLITRQDRLESIANDIVTHFIGLNTDPADGVKSIATKAMVIAIDKVTAVRMHDEVKRAWAKRLGEEKKKLASYQQPHAGRAAEIVNFMQETDMAVVVSQSQNEVDTFKKKGLDITGHRARMQKEDLDTKFKDDKDPLRLVFVCAMWMTGFDVPSCGVVYLDKPMRNHTLMQTIARANRVFEGKVNGLVVDYVGVFRNLQKALAIYGTSSGGGVRPGDSPVQPKDVQLAELADAIRKALSFCAARGVDVDACRADTPLARITALHEAVDKLVQPPEEKKKDFLDLAGHVERVYAAIGVDDRKNAHAADWGVISDLARGIRALEEPVDISGVMSRVEHLLDDSIDTAGYVMLRETPGAPFGNRVHLGKIDFDALRRFFAKTKQKAAVAETTVNAVRRRVDAMVQLNPTRTGFREHLENLIEEYNHGARSTGDFFKELLAFIAKLDAEEQRSSAEGLTEETLAIRDLVLVPSITLTPKEQALVNDLVRDLPKKLEKRLVIDWRKNQRSRAGVKAAIKDALDSLPGKYDAVFEDVLNAVYEHVYESYWGDGTSKYKVSDDAPG